MAKVLVMSNRKRAPGLTLDRDGNLFDLLVLCCALLRCCVLVRCGANYAVLRADDV
jgi:hypothetical protein